MRVLIKEYQYHASSVADCLHGLDYLENINHMVSVNYVGYFYNPHLKDCVFILPKVLMDNNDKVFSHLMPDAIIHLDEAEGLTREEMNFIYEFAVWIFRAISVYNKANKENGIVYHKLIAQMGSSKKHLSNTFLDVLLSIIRFNRENQDYFTFILKNLHSGLNKINWNRTIANSNAIIEKEIPVYLNPYNKKRQINFDEELLIIFFSILKYINERYGFPVNISIGYELIGGKQFEMYLKGMGKKRLNQIKYKYFSDRDLRIWELCYAFFDKVHQISINAEQQEYLLVKNFNIVFEAIIDELVGSKDIPHGLKEQYDGKRVDHMYNWQGLIENEDKQIYYIGDSKYYKLGNKIGKESVYKQYTYARNVIQWNLDLFMSGKQNDSVIKLRDDLTEGYNIIPNFFISAKMDKELSYADKIYQTDKADKSFISTQFENRLFDRDTLLIFHYNVNFLYVVSLYARDNESQKIAWKTKVRNMFRNEIQALLKEKYEFYAMTARPSVDAKAYLKSHFQDVLGKVFTPYNDHEIMSLALDVEDPKKENKALLSQLSEYFVIEKCEMGQNPIEVLEVPLKSATIPIQKLGKDGVLMIMMEGFNYKKLNFLNDCIIAIGLKNTPERQNIIDNLSSIGFILFHTRNDEGQHLYRVEKPCQIMVADEIDKNIYKNIKTTSLYAVIEFNNIEIDSSSLHSGKAHFEKQTRYDSQYIDIEYIK